MTKMPFQNNLSYLYLSTYLKLHDVVALTKPIPEYDLRRGDIGVVVDIGPDNQYLLEFADRNGIPYAMPTVNTEGLMKVYLHADMVE